MVFGPHTMDISTNLLRLEANEEILDDLLPVTFLLFWLPINIKIHFSLFDVPIEQFSSDVPF